MCLGDSLFLDLFKLIAPPKSTYPPVLLYSWLIFKCILTTSAFLYTTVIYFMDSSVSVRVILKKRRNGLPYSISKLRKKFCLYLLPSKCSRFLFLYIWIKPNKFTSLKISTNLYQLKRPFCLTTVHCKSIDALNFSPTQLKTTQLIARTVAAAPSYSRAQW
jgi:hypothetical protein